MTYLIFLGALVAPLLYATNNHIDKVLLEKYFKGEGGVGTLLMFSSLLSAAMLPILLYIEPAAMQIGMKEAGILAFVGFLNVVLLWAYLSAMDDEEPTVVIIFYQLVPAVGLFLGYILLDEVISNKQLAAMILIIAGASIMTFASDEDGKFTIKFKTLGYMLVASLCWAGESTLFKMVALEENVVRSLFWEQLSLTAFGVVLFIFVPSYRQSFLAVFKMNSKKVVGINALNEALYMAGNAMASIMVMKILVGINLMMNSFQPFFVLVLGWLINRFWPGLSTENTAGRRCQKTIAIVLTGIGVYLIGEW
jgi:drug/metabolite transporter (DMT)-like permease